MQGKGNESLPLSKEYIEGYIKDRFPQATLSNAEHILKVIQEVEISTSDGHIGASFFLQKSRIEPSVQLSNKKIESFRCTCANSRISKQICTHIAVLLKLYMKRYDQTPSTKQTEPQAPTTNSSSEECRIGLGPLSQSLEYMHTPENTGERYSEGNPRKRAHIEHSSPKSPSLITPSAESNEVTLLDSTPDQKDKLIATLKQQIETLEAQNQRLRFEIELKESQLRAVTERLVLVQKTQESHNDPFRARKAILSDRIDSSEFEHVLKDGIMKPSTTGVPTEMSSPSIKPFQTPRKEEDMGTPPRQVLRQIDDSPDWLPEEVEQNIKSGTFNGMRAGEIQQSISFRSVNESDATIDPDDFRIMEKARRNSNAAKATRESRPHERPALRRTPPRPIPKNE